MDPEYEEWRSNMAKRAKRAQRTTEEIEKYPECNKWASIQTEIRAIRSFLDWCHETHEVSLMSFDQRGDPEIQGNEGLLREYFEIDSNKLEEERRRMLEEQRALSGESVSGESDG
jgi:hypothetical protein